MQKAAPALLAQPVVLAPDGDDVAVVEHPVEARGGHDRVAEDEEIGLVRDETLHLLAAEPPRQLLDLQPGLVGRLLRLGDS